MRRTLTITDPDNREVYVRVIVTDEGRSDNAPVEMRFALQAKDRMGLTDDKLRAATDVALDQMFDQGNEIRKKAGV
jgi:hypothetical protein